MAQNSNSRTNVKYINSSMGKIISKRPATTFRERPVAEPAKIERKPKGVRVRVLTRAASTERDSAKVRSRVKTAQPVKPVSKEELAKVFEKYKSILAGKNDSLVVGAKGGNVSAL